MAVKGAKETGGAVAAAAEDGRAADEAVGLKENGSRMNKPSRQMVDKDDVCKPLSEVEARRAKYLRRGAAGEADKGRREEDTLARLQAFRGRVLEKKGKFLRPQKDGAEADGGGKRRPKKRDASLATRMAQRTERAERDKLEEEVRAEKGTYHGQVMERSDEELEGDEDGRWMEGKFKCRRHIDHAAKGIGGDGRSADDYVVIDGERGDEGGFGRRGQRGKGGNNGGRGGGHSGHSGRSNHGGRSGSRVSGRNVRSW